ncbi:uncharacterized protein LOC120191304 [Hibiscus syriacus]|uniref:uncharacterized protein LOC120191304 n=1 Tax=Hibiscus syriacus TaxID=106335 RepID=UPI00192304ED|nr:uncharacterized protein LOC120191304 [Hibiscus syriacus]
MEEALKDPRWREVVKEEIKALESNKTWTLIELPQAKKKLIVCKWVFTMNYNSNEIVERFKSRLVAKGFTQSYGIEFHDTFALVAKLNTVRVLLILIVNEDWELHQLDIKKVFLNGNLEEEVYIRLYLGMEEASPPVTNVTKVVEGEDKTERNYKRIRPTEGDGVLEEGVPKRSWKDAVISPTFLPGNFQLSTEVEDEGSDDEAAPEGDDIPTIRIPQELKEKLRKPWRKALIIKILGKTVAYKILISRITNLWKLEGEFDCIDLGYGFYAIKFQNMLDRAKVLMEGPWKIMDHYITVQRWRPNFVAAKASIPSTAVWIHIPGLPIEYFEESILCNLGKLVGKPLKIDYHTAWSTRGRFARICVEIDLDSPLLSKVRIENRKEAPMNREANMEPQVSEHQVQRRTRGIRSNQRNQSSRIFEPRQNNRFDGLNIMDEDKICKGKEEHSRKQEVNETSNKFEMSSKDMKSNRSEEGNSRAKDNIPADSSYDGSSRKTKGNFQSPKLFVKRDNQGSNNRGFRRGLILLWNSNSQKVSIRYQTDQVIHCEIQENDKIWLLSTVYIQPHSTKKDEAWDNIYDYSTSVDLPWMIMGDFNDFASLDERVGSSFDCMDRIIKFHELWNRCNLMDAGYVGSKFTWTRHSQGRVTLQERLDRLLHNIELVNCFPNLRVVTLTRMYSDHNPILVNTDLELPVDKEKRPFRLEAAWMMHDDFNRIFSSAWDKKKNSLVDAVEETKRTLIEWKESTFGNIFKRKKILMKQLQGIQRSTNYFHSNYLQELEKTLKGDYQQVLEQEEIFWLQKSRLDWIVKGERNTKFFHLTTMIRRKFNKIVGLYIENVWVTGKQDLCQHVYNYYKELFAGKEYIQLSRDYDSFIPRLMEEEKIELTKQVTMEEVKETLFSMKGLKAPGSDGIQPIFYKQNWETVRNTLLDFVNKTLESRKMEGKILRTFLVLIPKITVADNITQFRPISLLNTSYKIFSKIIARRLCPMLQRLIGPYQNSFLKGRSTSDNILIVQ